MEIVDFSDRRFDQIPDQDNPAMSHKYWDEERLGPEPKNRCLMLVQAHSYHHIGSPGVTVLEIDNPENKGDRVLGLGVFYSYDSAKLFAEAYAEKHDKK